MFLQSTLAQTLGDTAAQSPVVAQLAEETADKMNLFDMALKGGWIMLILLLLSIVCFYMKSGENKSAVIFCQATASPISRIVEKGIGLADHDTKDIQLGMENAANVEIAKLEKGLKGLSTIASAAPMIGFLGTVIGMVRAFWEMANAGNNIDVSLLSSGIYEAMITTVGGLIVGIIALFAYNYLVARVDSIANEMESFIQDFTVNLEK